MVRSSDACHMLPDGLHSVRCRSKEIVKLLESDVDKIRAAQRTAKASRSKHIDVGDESQGPSSTDILHGGASGNSGNRTGSDCGYSGSYSGDSNLESLQGYDVGDETPPQSSPSTSDAHLSNPHRRGKSIFSQHTTVPTNTPENLPVQEVDPLRPGDNDIFGNGSIFPPPVSAPGLAQPQPTGPFVSPDSTLITPRTVDGIEPLLPSPLGGWRTAKYNESGACSGCGQRDHCARFGGPDCSIFHVVDLVQ